MSRAGSEFRKQFLMEARHSLEKHYLPRIKRCLKLLSEADLWWKSHSTSNSVGNLVLHLSGHVRQWIISGLGGAPDVRERDKEFAELGPIRRRVRVTGFKAIFHVAEHFAYHAGQIILVTKLRRGEDMGFTRLPGEKRKPSRLPPI